MGRQSYQPIEASVELQDINQSPIAIFTNNLLNVNPYSFDSIWALLQSIKKTMEHLQTASLRAGLDAGLDDILPYISGSIPESQIDQVKQQLEDLNCLWIFIQGSESQEATWIKYAATILESLGNAIKANQEKQHKEQAQAELLIIQEKIRAYEESEAASTPTYHRSATRGQEKNFVQSTTWVADHGLKLLQKSSRKARERGAVLFDMSADLREAGNQHFQQSSITLEDHQAFESKIDTIVDRNMDNPAVKNHRNWAMQTGYIIKNLLKTALSFGRNLKYNKTHLGRLWPSPQTKSRKGSEEIKAVVKSMAPEAT